jgi:hypothetical protein
MGIWDLPIADFENRTIGAGTSAQVTREPRAGGALVPAVRRDQV